MHITEMTDHQKGSMEGMKSMGMNMIEGHPDVSFTCGRIAHHGRGLIDPGDNEMKAMALMVIDAQKKEIEELAAWVEKKAT